MKYFDWNAIIFVSVSLIHDYWIYWRLPQIQYWETYKDITVDDHDDKNKAA
ncbi:hypothetical protein WMZ97_15455 [Lentibacillus sp. N15]|uniref:hypothetical protein n=1 Tax=Lentibacillus songyuanensis TaxID=3136161 RepID=UPI0031BA1151